MADFELNIMTPEKLVFSGRAESLVVTATDGERCVLAGHAPLAATLGIGFIRFLTGGEWKIASASEGFMEVMDGRANVYLQTCEYPEDIDIERAQSDVDKFTDLLKQGRHFGQYGGSEGALKRAAARLRMAQRKQGTP